MKLKYLVSNIITPENLINLFCPSDFGYKNDCPDNNEGRAVYDCEKCWNKEGKSKNGLTHEKKEILKSIMGSVKTPVDLEVKEYVDKSENLIPPIKRVYDEMYGEWYIFDSNDTIIGMLMTEIHARQLCWLVNGSQFRETKYILKEDNDEIVEMEDDK